MPHRKTKLFVQRQLPILWHLTHGILLCSFLYIKFCDVVLNKYQKHPMHLNNTVCLAGKLYVVAAPCAQNSCYLVFIFINILLHCKCFFYIYIIYMSIFISNKAVLLSLVYHVNGICTHY